MKHYTAIVIVALFSISFITNTIHADEIIWPKPAFPPYAFFAEDKELNGKGCDQLMIQYLVHQLPSHWKHTFIKANYKRIVRMISDGDPAIIMGLFKTQERINKGVLYNEIPMTLTLSNVMVILKKKFP